MLVLSRVVRATSTVVGPAGRRALSLSGSRTRVTMDGMEAKAARAEAMVATLRERLNVLRSLVEQEEVNKLTAENAKLQADVDAAKAKLREIKAQAGLPHFPLPGEPGYKPPAAAAAAAAAADVKATTAAVKKDKGGQAKAAPAAGSGKSADQADGSKKNKKPWVKGDGADAKSPPGAGGPEVVDASLLDLRVGNIVTAEPHPESDKLFIEKIDVGTGELVVVLSGLNGKVPLEEMQNRPVVLLMNLKPAKMGGIQSNAMVMCASADTVEPIDPPAGAVPGDVVTFPGISAPDKKPANANAMKKKKYLEALLPDLKTNGECVACYKGVPFTIEGKGVCTVKSMKGAPIK